MKNHNSIILIAVSLIVVVTTSLQKSTILRSSVPYRIETSRGVDYARCVRYDPMTKTISYLEAWELDPDKIFVSSFEECR